MIRTLLTTAVFLSGGCEVDIGEIPAIEHEIEGAVAIEWPLETTITIAACTTPEAEIHHEDQFAGFVESRYSVPRCGCSPSPDAMWLRPPEGCGVFIMRRTNDWCVDTDWAGCAL